MKEANYFIAITLLVGHISCSSGQETGIFDKDFGMVKLADNSSLAEGPAVNPERELFYSDHPGDKISKIDKEGKVEVFMQPAGVTNGMAFDYQGRLILCQTNNANYPQDSSAAKRRILRIEKEGQNTILADTINGQPLIGPNDICLDKKGRIYFTDPWYPNPKVLKTQPASGVYRIDAPGEITLLLDSLLKPNGILITPDNKYLYVSDRGTQRLHRYHLYQDGSLKFDKYAYDFGDDRGIDGMAIDTNGYIYGAAGSDETAGVYVIDPEKGTLIDFLKMPTMVYNVCFGGEDQQNLYVASGGSIYLVRTLNKGVVLPL